MPISACFRPGMALRLLPAFALLAPLGSLAACGPAYDPQTREGLWHPVHVNRANLVLTVENPSDLTYGKGTTGADGQLASAAVERLRVGKVKKLPDSNIAQVTASGGGSSSDSTSTSSSQ